MRPILMQWRRPGGDWTVVHLAYEEEPQPGSPHWRPLPVSLCRREAPRDAGVMERRRGSSLCRGIICHDCARVAASRSS